MGKGEIAHYEQFLLFPQCFQKVCFPGASKRVIVLEWVKAKEYNINSAREKHTMMITVFRLCQNQQENPVKISAEVVVSAVWVVLQ